LSCEDRRDPVLLFAFGLLEEPEAAELRAHLAGGCAACTAHLAEARGLRAAIDLASGEEEPPAALRAALLRRIDRVPRLAAGPAARSGALQRLAPLALAAGVATLVAAPIGWLLSQSRARGELAAGAAELVALRETSSDLERRLEEVGEEQEELDEELAEIEARSRTLESDLERARRQVAMLVDPGLVTLDLGPTGAQSGARARVFWEWHDYYCYLDANGLPDVKAPAVYALWLDTEGGNRILAGTFAPAEGHATLWVQLPRDMGRAVAAEVTLEPEAPGPSPAGPVQLRSGAPRHS
jgi:hypothetical protein